MNRFIRELRRREVFRAAGLYVGICWIVIEVSSTILPTFDAPDWILRAIIITAIVGFPVMLVLAWIFDVTSHGIEVQAEATDTIFTPFFTRKTDYVVIGVLSVALLISLYLNIAGGPRVTEQHGIVSILIADFDNRTGDAVFDGALEQALQIGVESASFISTFQRAAALSALAQIQQTESRVLGPEQARLVAVREGIDVVLTGSIETAGDGYRIVVRMLDGATGEAIDDVDEEADSKLAVLESVGRISGALRKDLGDDSVGHGNQGSVETFTAASIEAARDYTQAQELARAGRHEEAVPLYESAVTKDPDFGRALSGWALSLFYLGRTEEATALWERALSKMGTMTERERLRTLGLYYMVVSGNYPKAAESYEQLVASYPADGPGQNNLAIAYFSMLEFDKAREQGRRVLEMYPDAARFRSNYALYAMYAGDFESASREAKQTLELDANRYIAWLPIAMASAAVGELAAARDAYQGMKTSSQRGESVSSLGVADLELYAGDYTAAIDTLRSGIEFELQTGNRSVLAAKRIAYAEALLAAGRTDAGVDAINAALETSGLAQEVPAAIMLLGNGASERAADIANKLGEQLNTQSRAYALMIQAMIDAANGDHIAAVDKYTAAVGLADLWLVRFQLGRAYLQAGFNAEAMNEFDQCKRRIGEATAIFLNDLPTWRYTSTLPYWLGRAQAELGMTQQAAANLDAFIRARPADDPLAQDARQRRP
jgi:tetratricopeptide (TPR) repeat protein